MTDIFFDELPIHNENVKELSENKIFLLTRPFDLTSVNVTDAELIFTTFILKSVMICDEEVREKIQTIDDFGEPTEIGERMVRLFSCDSKTLNVIAVLELGNRFDLYAGRFTTGCCFTQHKFIRKLLGKNAINELYVDATAAAVTEYGLLQMAVRQINEIRKDNKQYTIHLVIDDFGYEDLIYALTRCNRVHLDEHTRNIFVKQMLEDDFCSDAKNADIITIRKPSEDTKRQFQKKKIITVMFSIEQIKSTDHCVVIKFTNHPTESDVQYINHMACPKKIIAIKNTGDIPKSLITLI